MEEHSGIYECIYLTDPEMKAQVNISGDFACLLLGLRREQGSCGLLNTWVPHQLLEELLRPLLTGLQACKQLLPDSLCEAAPFPQVAGGPVRSAPGPCLGSAFCSDGRGVLNWGISTCFPLKMPNKGQVRGQTP